MSRERPAVPHPGASAFGRHTTPARVLLLAIVAAAVLTPGISIDGRLPDVRIEQVLALPALALLLLHPWSLWHWPGFSEKRAGNREDRPAVPGSRRTERHMPPTSAGDQAGAPSRDRFAQVISGRQRRPPRFSRPGLGLLDAAFAAFALATLVSTITAPLLLGERFSPRDLYEVVKPALYWLLLRFALVAASDTVTRRTALAVFFVAAGLSALLGLVQYLGAEGFGRRLAEPWAPAHHLRALARDGRALGTVGNPNYFGALMAVLTLTGLGSLVDRAGSGRARRLQRLALAAVALGPLGVVLSGSRGALALLLVGLFVCTGAALLACRTGSDAETPGLRRRTRLAAGAVLLALALSVLFVEALPRGRQSYLARVAGTLAPRGDSSLALRLERWRSSLGLPGTSGGSDLPGPPLSGSGRPSAGPEARARDEQRKADVRALVEAVRRHRAAHGALPAALSALTPPPVADLSPFALLPAGDGFVVTASLEDPANPDYPQFAAGDGGNYLLDGDAEHGGGFRSLPGTSVERTQAAALYGAAGFAFRGNPEEPARRAALYQQRAFNRTGGQYTAALWVKLPRPVQGEVFLYTNVLYSDGTRADPFARIAADSVATGIWQRLSLTITPDPARRIDFIGVYLLSDSFSGEAWADGFQLVDGPVPRSFTGLPEAAPDGGSDTGAAFRRSPLLGAGPGKATGGATLDNEYLLVLTRYGLLGLAAYLALWAALAVLAVRRLRAGRLEAAALVGIVAGLALFNLVAGSLYHLQLMGVLWPLAGVLLARDAAAPLSAPPPSPAG